MGGSGRPRSPPRARRRQSPWDDADRRPLHGDRCNALRRQCVRERITRARSLRSLTGAIQNLLRGLVQMVT